MRSPLRLAALVIVAALGTSLPAASQIAGRTARSDPRWEPWLGCWTPADAGRVAQDVQVCVVPTADEAGVTMLTVAGGRTILEERIVADRAPKPVEENGCEGSRQSRWAEHGNRLFTTATLRCTGQPAQETSGIAALLTSSQWLDIQVVDIDGRQAVRTRRYARSSGPPPAPVADALRKLPPTLPVPTSILTIDDVIEAHQAVSPRAVEAWLVEAEPRLPIDRRALVKMTDARLSEPVIDLLVALAYPSHFEVRRRAPRVSGGGGPIITSIEEPGGFWGPWGLAYDPYTLMFSPFAAGYYPGFPNFYDYSYGGYIEIPGGGGGAAEPGAGHGQVVNGQGYTRVQPREAVGNSGASRSGGASTSSAGLSSGSSGDSGGSAGVSSASPAGYSSGGGGSSGGATAVPR
jgi:hypothetical protein